MNKPRIVGVFGISGVGKSTLITRVCEEIPNCLHLQASALIKAGLADPLMYAESLRRCSGDQIRANQDILVESFWRRVRLRGSMLILFDGHLLVDTDEELIEVPRGIIGRLQPSLMVHVEDEEAKIAARRSNDVHRVRPARSEGVLHEHQRRSRRLCEIYASELGIEASVLQPDEVDRFRAIIRNLGW